MDSRHRTLGLFLLTALLFGGTFAAIKSGLAVVPPVFFAALRFDIGGVVLIAYAANYIDNWRPRSRRDWRAVIAGALLFVAANNVFLFLGQQFTSSAIAAVMYSFSPVLTPVFALFLLRDERLSKTGIVGILVGFVGIAIVAQPDSGNLLTGDIIGMGLVLLAAVSVALGGVLIRRADPAMSSVGTSAWAMLLGAVVIHILSAALGETVSYTLWTSTTLLALAYIGIFATAVAYTIYFQLLDQIGPIKVSLVTYVVPVVATVIGWTLLGEPITVTMIVGFLFIFTGFVLLERQTFADELHRVSVTVPNLSARGQRSDSHDARTQQHSYNGGSVQSSDTSNCDD